VGVGAAEGRGGCIGEGDAGLAGVVGVLSIASTSVAMLEVSASLTICFWKFSIVGKFKQYMRNLFK
jgi:hypothetical protein